MTRHPLCIIGIQNKEQLPNVQTESSFKLKDRETIEHECNITRASHEIGSHPFHHTISKEFSLLSQKTMFKPGAKTLSLLRLLAKNMSAVYSGVGVIINSLICCLRALKSASPKLFRALNYFTPDLFAYAV